MARQAQVVTPVIFPDGTAVQAFLLTDCDVERRENRTPVQAPADTGVVADGTVTITAEEGLMYALFAVVDEVEGLTVDATSGTFTLKYIDQTTTDLAYNITAADLKTALEALSNIASGDVDVGGGPGDDGGTKPYVITFRGALAGEDVTALVVDGAKLNAATAEIQNIAVDATAGQFKVTTQGKTTADLAFNIDKADLQTALRGLTGATDFAAVTVTGGPGDSGATKPYILTYPTTLDPAQPTCASGTTPLSGGGAKVTPSTKTPWYRKGAGVVGTTTPGTKAFTGEPSVIFYVTPA
jgi:hypothetical protein